MARRTVPATRAEVKRVASNRPDARLAGPSSSPSTLFVDERAAVLGRDGQLTVGDGIAGCVAQAKHVEVRERLVRAGHDGRGARRDGQATGRGGRPGAVPPCLQSAFALNVPAAAKVTVYLGWSAGGTTP